MIRLEATIGVLMIALSGLVIWATAGLLYWPATTPGARFAPVWVSGAGIMLGLLLVWTALSHTKDRPVNWPDRAGTLRLVLIAISLWAVLGFADMLGFVTAAGLFCLVFTLAIMRCRLVPSLVATACIVLMLRVVFVTALDVKLPTGVFGF